MGEMKTYEIITVNGDIIEHISAKDERQALCIYLMSHEELDDMMLWKNPYGYWRLAEYDNETEFIFARKIYDF